MKNILEKTGMLLLAFFSGNEAKSQTWVEQLGTDNLFNSFSFSGETRPDIIDIDNDGDMDVISGACGEGWMVFLENDGTQYNQVAGPQNPFEGIASCASPEFVDIDNDGDLDLIVGAYDSDKYATLSLYLNDGLGNFSPPANDPFSGITFDYVANPAFSDIDGDGDMDLMVGENYALRIFDNNGDNTFTELDAANSDFADIQFLEDLTPEFGDIDMDGDEDVIFGNKYGDLLLFEKTDDGSFDQLLGEANPLDSIDNFINPFPSLFDYDNDGDIDLIVGQASGVYSFFLNSTISIGNDELSDIDLTIFPNPAQNILNLNTTERLDYANIFSMDGRLVLSKPFFNTDYRIDIENLESGNYVLRIAQGEHFYSRKIVKL